ncbi:hypothetical protein [Clostridium hydrogenum]|nr:hypothetical protein [Clostridium hydrogenum]
MKNKQKNMLVFYNVIIVGKECIKDIPCETSKLICIKMPSFGHYDAN